MIRVNEARVRPQGRVPTESDKQPSAQPKSYIAPIGGLETNAPLAAQGEQTALVLENFWPTSTGITPRGGSKIRCTIPNEVKSLFEYRAAYNRTYFAADENNIYEFTDNTLDGTALTASVTGQISADYSTLEMQTDGGSFLTAVNGDDYAQIYDGTSWQQVTASSSPLAITGVATNDLSNIWAHRNRTFFIEKATMNAWYLGINSVAGPATKLPLAGVFNKGGSLLFGATWSSDSGAGMDDRCVFVTDQGELAIYSGGNPGDVADWHLNGVYEIGEPLGKDSFMRVGGDIIIATKAGVVPISAATNKDPAQLKVGAVSRPVGPDWQRQAVLSGFGEDWQLVKWASRNMALIAPPNQITGQEFCWAINLETGAWTKFTGWQIRALGVLGDNLHFGDKDGNVFLGDIGGVDNTAPFECRACYSFDHLGAAGTIKTAHAIKGTWRFNKPFAAKYSVAKDYKPSFGAPPSAPLYSGGNQAEWDVSNWDEDYWAENEETYQIKKKWESVSAHGEVLAPQIQITSAQSAKLNCELISLNLLYSVGTVLG